jgi:hypothetical protein
VIAASGFFFHSLTYLATQKWFAIRWSSCGARGRDVVGAHVAEPRVSIRYFTRGHRGTTEWWFPERCHEAS